MVVVLVFYRQCPQNFSCRFLMLVGKLFCSYFTLYFFMISMNKYGKKTIIICFPAVCLHGNGCLSDEVGVSDHISS